MIFLSGHIHESLHYLTDFGFMLTPAMGNVIPRDHLWAADTGCFRKPDAFSLERYCRWLRAHNPETCLFATAPDVLANPVETFKRSLPVLPVLRMLGFSPAYVAQDGAERVPIPWADFDALFIGGNDLWKEGREAAALISEALRRGKWVHMGRVNGGKRGLKAEWRGCHSIDGSILKHGRDVNLPKVKEWLKFLNGQTCIPNLIPPR